MNDATAKLQTFERAVMWRKRWMALQDRVAALATQRLDPKRPLWQIHLVEDYTGPDGVKGSAMIVRIHHCIADGIALISVTMSLVDGGAPPPERRKKAATAGPEDWITDTLLKPFTDITVKALGAVGEGAARSLGMMISVFALQPPSFPRYWTT